MATDRDGANLGKANLHGASSVGADVMCRGPDYSRLTRSQQCHHDGSIHAQ